MNRAPANVASALLGLGLLSMAPVLMGGGGEPLFRRGRGEDLVRVAGIYDPKDAVRLSGEYTVPAGKTLLITGIGSVAGGLVTLDISNFWPNGTPESIRIATPLNQPTLELPFPGIVVRSGSRVTGGHVYGYVVDMPKSLGKAQLLEPAQDGAVHIVGLPGDPREFVYIRSNPGNPNLSYRVPVGKRLIITGIGASSECTSVQVRDYRVQLLLADLEPGELYYEVPKPGIPVSGGRIVNPLSDGGLDAFAGRAFGYLIDG